MIWGICKKIKIMVKKVSLVLGFTLLICSLFAQMVPQTIHEKIPNTEMVRVDDNTHTVEYVKFKKIYLRGLRFPT